MASSKSAFLETAYAKINLALHVRARRADGYHMLETLFAFVDDGDLITAAVADADSLTIDGEFAEGLSCGADNLVLRALALMRDLPGGGAIPPLAIELQKNLPVAAGVGGGSADAAALIRLVDREFLHIGDPSALIAATVALGADIGACILSETRIGRDTGWDLHPVAIDDVQGLPVLLINPRVPLPTGPVFAAWDQVDRGPLPDGSARAMARTGRNDLQPPATGICPEIDDVMTVLRAQLPTLARMSGSGATCFALFSNDAAMMAALDRIAADHPEYWLMAGHIR